MNLKTKVIATEVSNLTDARYFAAWGVDYMAYIVDSTDPRYIGVEGIKEIIDWVEGPASLGQLPGTDVPKEIDEVYKNLGLVGIISAPYIDSARLEDITPKVLRTIIDIDTTSPLEEQLLIVQFPIGVDMRALVPRLKTLAEVNELYIDGINTVTDLELLLNEVNPSGIVLKGGEEEKVGYKSYDELDEIFEWLEVD